MTRKTNILVANILFLALLLAGCSREKSAFTVQNAPRHFDVLQRVGELVESNPEIALDSIVSLKQAMLCDAKAWTQIDVSELNMREVQAQYKNRCLAATSPDLSYAVSLYDSLAQLFPGDLELAYLRANTYYYKGVQSAFGNNDVEAFRHYQQALAVMQELPSATALPHAPRFMALTYTRLGEVLYYYGVNNAAKTAFEKAYSWFVAADDMPSAALMKRNEALVYQADKDYGEALSLFAEAEAISPLDEEVCYHSKGSLLFEMQQYDSAAFYLEQSFRHADRIARADASAKLAEIFRLSGQIDQEIYYTRYYVENSLKEANLASRKIEIEYLNNNFGNATSAVQPSNGKGTSKSVWIIVVLFVLVIVLLTYIIIRNRKKINHIESKISSIESQHKQENADKDHELEQVTQQLNDTREQLENVTKTTFEESWNNFSNSAIANKIRHLVEGKDIMIKSVGSYPKLKLKEVDFLELIRVANACFMDFSTHLLHDYPDLTTSDLRHCCLSLLGMNDAEIAVLEGISYSGSNRRSKKIIGVLGMDNSLEQSVLMYLRNYW